MMLLILVSLLVIRKVCSCNQCLNRIPAIKVISSLPTATGGCIIHHSPQLQPIGPRSSRKIHMKLKSNHNFTNHDDQLSVS